MQVASFDHLPDPVMTIADIEAFLEHEFPQVHQDGRVFTVEHVAKGTVTYRLTPQDRHLRPGGTVSGPSMFALADVAAYVCILAHIGPVKHTVTTNMNINFMHKPQPGPLDCHARLLKLGKRLAVVDSLIVDSEGRTVSQATATYSIPA
ncbi:MAG: PaaI family thioesterase [Pseudomonadota bacterium]